MSDNDGYILSGSEIHFDIPPVTLGQLIFKSLHSASPDDVINVEAESGRSVTCSEFLLHSIRIASAMRDAGLQQGDCIAFVGKNGIDICAAAVACFFNGGKMTPIDPYIKTHEYEHMFNIVEPKLIFCDADICDFVSQAVANLGMDVMLILLFSEPNVDYQFTKIEDFIKKDVDYTKFAPIPSADSSKSIALLACSSGTTGPPKAVMHTDKSLVFQLISWRNMGSKSTMVKRVWLHVSHFFWISGIALFLTCTCGVLKRILVRNVRPKNVLEAIDKYKTENAFMPPVLVHSIVNHPDFDKYKLNSLLFLSTGGGSLQRATYDQVKEKWPNPNLILLQGYGSTEVGGIFTMMNQKHDIASVGELVPGAKLKIVKDDGELAAEGEIGELYLKSMSMMVGYVKNEEATKESLDEDGWWRSGDRGYHKNNCIYITGRLKELIKTQGLQIAPSELEELILTIPGVADVGVAGIKIDEYTSHPMALVVKEEGSDVTEEDIMKCVNENMAEYKHLKAGVVFVDKIPRTPTGKIKRVDLQAMADTLYLGD